MNYKVKNFLNPNGCTLQNEYKEWIEKQSNINIVNISFFVNPHEHMYYVTITYFEEIING